MSKSTIILIAVIAVVGMFGMTLMSSYNGLVAAQEQVNGKWSQIDTMLQRRADLIPNLVNTVKGFAAQEKSVIDSVTNARAKLAGDSVSGRTLTSPCNPCARVTVPSSTNESLPSG